MVIEFLNEKNFDISDEFYLEIERATAITLDVEEFHYDAELAIAFVDNEEIRELNKKYRKIDSVTDVLSFPANELTPGKYNFNEEDEPIQLGDIVISYEKAKSQAEEHGQLFMHELMFLTIHSVLHLLGYDHETDEDDVIMSERLNEILLEIDTLR